MQRAIGTLLLTLAGLSRAHAFTCVRAPVLSPRMSASEIDAARALEFCRSSKTAVIATVWPTASIQASEAKDWLIGSGCDVVYEHLLTLKPSAAVPTILALYHGEEWLESNCWCAPALPHVPAARIHILTVPIVLGARPFKKRYMESPLPDGPPCGPYAGAKWKAALAFREEAPMHVFVVDVAQSPCIWSGKYAIREQLRQKVGAIAGPSLTRASTVFVDAGASCGSGSLSL